MLNSGKLFGQLRMKEQPAPQRTKAREKQMKEFESTLEVPAHHFLIGKTKGGKTTALIFFFEQLRKTKQKPFSPPNGQIVWVPNDEIIQKGKDTLVTNYMNFLSKDRQGTEYHGMAILPCNDLEEVYEELNKLVDENDKRGLNTAVVLDNLGHTTGTSNAMTKLLTYGRHSNMSIFNILHGFFNGPILKRQRAQIFYFWCFYVTGKDIQSFLEQNFPEKEVEAVRAIITDSHKKKWGYTLLDLGAMPGDTERFTNRFRKNYVLEPYDDEEVPKLIKKING